jgi:hypothetical protein
VPNLAKKADAKTINKLDQVEKEIIAQEEETFECQHYEEEEARVPGGQQTVRAPFAILHSLR